MNTITRSQVLDTLTHYFLPHLLATEDFDTFIRDVALETRNLSREAVGYAIEEFDEQVREQAPRSWEIKDRPKRSIITVLGKITYSRTLFIDEYKRPRYLTDEILGIKKHARYSADAFLWIVMRAAFVSFRNTAKGFEELSGEYVSQVTVMKMVHKEGALIKEYLLESKTKENTLSQQSLFIESDGVFIALQSPEKRKAAIARHLYESIRTKRSVELKCEVSYAGKTATSEPTRKKRGNVLAACTTEDAGELFKICAKDIERNYEVEDIGSITCGSDGGECYKKSGLDAMFCGATHTHVLDPFHIVRALTVAFPDKALKSKMLSVVYAREFKGFSALCSYLCDAAETKTEQDKIIACRKYIENNKSSIDMNANLGTMEGTIAHIWAKRMKNNGTSWSVRGMEAMGLVRAFVCTGRKLIVPPKEVFFTEKEKESKELWIKKSCRYQGDSVGEGYLPAQGKISHERYTGQYMGVLAALSSRTYAAH